MAGSSTSTSRQNVSREEFSAFQHHIDTQFGTVNSKFSSLEQSIGALGRKFDEGSKPNYSVMISIGGLILVISGMAASLHSSQLESVMSQSNSQDASILERMNYVENGSNRHTKQDQRNYELDTREWQYRQDDDIERLDSRTAQLEALLLDTREEVDRRGEWMNGTTEQIHRLDAMTRYHLKLDRPESDNK